MVPDILLSNQGRNVDGEVIRQMCIYFGIEKRHSSPYHPQRDGQVERTVEIVKQALRCLPSERRLDKTVWPNILQEVAFNVNSLKSNSTNFTPQELMFGAKIRSALDQTIGISKYPSTDKKEEWHEAAEHMTRSKAHSKEHYDRRTVGVPTTVCTGQTVMYRSFTRSGGLEKMYTGSYSVVDVKYPRKNV